MMVSSDGYDLRYISQRWGLFAWSENLVGGVVFYGLGWAGAASALDFFKGAADIGGLLNVNICAYGVIGEKRNRNAGLSHLEKKFARRDDDLAKVRSLVFRESRPGAGTKTGDVTLGGEVGVYPNACESADHVQGHFLFPWRPGGDLIAQKLLQLAEKKLHAGYGYCFLRDEYAFPGGFATGYSPAFSAYDNRCEERRDITAWSNLIKGWVRGESALILRDVFNVNLIGGELMNPRLGENLTLIEWIRSDPRTGRLTQIRPTRYLWTLSDEEIAFVRPLLQDMGVCVAKEPHYYRNV